MCRHNPQLLEYDWAVELVRSQAGNVDLDGCTALIWLFNGNADRTDFSSLGFNLLWEKEKRIEINELKYQMC